MSLDGNSFARGVTAAAIPELVNGSFYGAESVCVNEETAVDVANSRFHSHSNFYALIGRRQIDTIGHVRRHADGSFIW